MPDIRDFKEFLTKKARIVAFRAFLKTEFSEENLDFWIEVEAYKSKKSENKKKIANKIFNRFVAIDSPKEINIDASTREEINENMNPPNPSTFDAAQYLVFILMKRDSFGRFLDRRLMPSITSMQHHFRSRRVSPNKSLLSQIKPPWKCRSKSGKEEDKTSRN